MDDTQRKKIEIMDKLSDLAYVHDLPVSFNEYCLNINQAFNLGREYEKMEEE